MADAALPVSVTEGPLQFYPIQNRSDGVIGVSFLQKGGVVPPHRHEEHELYMGLEGSCRVTINGKVTDHYSPCVIEIPGDAPHMLEAPRDDFTFFYLFREGPFQKVIYKFDGERPAL